MPIVFQAGSIFSLVLEFEYDTVGFWISENRCPRLELRPDLPLVSLGKSHSVHGQEVRHHQEKLHVGQLSSRADTRPNPVWKESLLVGDQFSVIKEVLRIVYRRKNQIM